MSSDGKGLLDALRRLLPELDAATLDAARCRALEGGVNRRSYQVDVGGKRYVLRLPTAGAEGLLDVATEARAMRAAAALDIAPHVAAVDAATGLLLTEYRDRAVPWTAAGVTRPRNIVRAAQLLRSLHAIQIELPVYAAERIARGYLSALAAGVSPELARFGGARIEAWAHELIELARRYDALHAPTAFCHNDLVAANWLDDGELMLVDFEYAVRGSPLLDLAGLAGMNDFGDAEQRALLEAYDEDAATTRARRAELAQTVRMVRLLSFFWARLGETRVADGAPYSRLAAQLSETLQ